MKNTEQDDDSVFIFKRKEAYALSVVIVIVALGLEAFVLFECSGGGAGKLLAAIPVFAVLIIKSIFKNSQQSN
jgi:hypothetical protein